MFEVCWTFCFNFNSLFDTDNGVFGSFFTENYIQDYFPTNFLFYALTTNLQLKVYLAVIILLITGYIAGYFPKLLSLIITMLLSALYAKYNILLAGWQQYMLCLLFLSSFVIEYNETAETKLNYWYEFVILFQIGFIYFFNAVFKTGAIWLDGSAIEMSFRHYPLTTSFGNTLLQFPTFLKVLTYGTLFYEVALLFLFIFFFKNKRMRFFLGISLILFHLGIQITMQVGHFYLVAISVGVLILPLNNFIPNRIIQHPFFAVKKYTPVLVKNKFFHKVIAVIFIYCIIISNVYQNELQECNKNKMDFSKTLVSKCYPGNINYVPFFYQFWHFFAPNPPLKAGAIAVIGTSEDDSAFIVYNGKKADYAAYTGINKYLAVYTALRDYNMKDKLFIESSLREQFKRWNANELNPRLINLGMYEFYGIRYIDHLNADELMSSKVPKSLKLNFELKYKNTQSTH